MLIRAKTGAFCDRLPASSVDTIDIHKRYQRNYLGCRNCNVGAQVCSRTNATKTHMAEQLYFIYGLAFFSLAIASLLEMRESSELPLGRQLPWLALFGLMHSAVEWCDMFLLRSPSPDYENALLLTRTILLPLSAVMLIRFGIGLLAEVGPLPNWTSFAHAVLFVPAMLLVAYALVVITTETHPERTADTWSRYLLFLPGGLMTSLGFARHWFKAPQRATNRRYRWLLVAAGASFLYAITAGLIVERGPYGLAPWVNYEAIERLTRVPIQLWRTVAGVTLTGAVIRALGLFAAERRHQINLLQRERERAQHAALLAQRDARQIAERWSETLVQISRQISTLEPLEDILTAIVDRGRVLLRANAAALALWDENYEKLMVKAFASATEKGMLDRPVTQPLIIDTVRARRASLLPSGDGWYCDVLDSEVRSAAIVPLTFEGETLGALWTVSTKSGAFNETDLNHIEHLSDQAVIAIQHALMAARLQSLAVVEERARIAREMHDGLAQLLGYVSLEVQTVEAFIRQDNHEAALAELGQARNRINSAQADVRENILSLRTTLAGEADLAQSLREYIDEFGIQTGITTRFINELGEPPNLSPLAETQLVCIVQEALANVRKHANARNVELRLSAQDGHLHVSVSDDGTGFVPHSARGHFGLETMRERSQSAGGELTVTSTLDEGTTVALWLPQLQQ